MRYILSIIFISVIFLACNDKDKKVVKKKPVDTLVEKVIAIKDKNTSFAQILKDDGIEVDGYKEERLLNAFQLAVSQVMVEEGVSVPDCDSLSKTGYLSLKDCNDITNKYFGFYELDENGNAKKVDDIFKDGVKGESIEIKDSEIEFFDSSGNPLLNNLVEFEDIVDSSDDLSILLKLESKIPKNNKKMKSKIAAKINFLKDVQKEKKRIIIKKQKVKVKKSNNKSDDYIKNSQEENNNVINEELKSARMGLNKAVSNLSSLKERHASTEVRLNTNPDSSRYQDMYENEEVQISEAEANIDYYQSLIESYAQ